MIGKALEYVRLLRESGPLEWVWRESRDLAEIRFRFQVGSPGTSRREGPGAGWLALESRDLAEIRFRFQVGILCCVGWGRP